MMLATLPVSLMSAATVLATVTSRRAPLESVRVLTFIYYQLRSTEKRVNIWLRDICTSDTFAHVNTLVALAVLITRRTLITSSRALTFIKYYLRPTEKRAYFWLRDICRPTAFAIVGNDGACSLDRASYSDDVRPCFNLFIHIFGLLQSRVVVAA